MFGLSLTYITALIPLIGGFFILWIGNDNLREIKISSLWVSFFSLCFAVFAQLNTTGDKLTALFVPIISLIVFISVLWHVNKQSQMPKLYFVALLLFEALAIGAFCSSDMFLIFILMESTTIPIYVMMASEENPSNNAIFQYTIYTLLSALLVLIAIIMIYLETKTSNLLDIYEIGVKNKKVLWLLATGIGIKMPIWPFYHWLPIVHVKSQTVCSVIFASIILKFSSLLIIRFIDPLFLNELQLHSDIITVLLIVSMGCALSQLIYQDDMKSLFAYVSIIHLNLYFITLLSGLNIEVFIFSIIQHSILMAILFFSIGLIKDTTNTRSILELQPISCHNLSTKILALLSFMTLIATPLTGCFISEVSSIYAAIKIGTTYGIIVAVGILLLSVYAGYICVSCFNKPTKIMSIQYGIDVSKKITLGILFGLMLFYGIFPKCVLGS
ncbi:MAG: hypothetical protein LBT03_03280 [Holosporales bacterium]|jgi:NADH:ubiquinone oxidoreductase subunit 4 (subunit M)|nr:hypothetical protein [Holosporales bacterium]